MAQYTVIEARDVVTVDPSKIPNEANIATGLQESLIRRELFRVVRIEDDQRVWLRSEHYGFYAPLDALTYHHTPPKVARFGDGCS